MILFDTSVIIDARDPSSPWHRWAQERIAEAVSAQGAAINTVILSEACVRALEPQSVPEALQKLGLNLLPLPVGAAVLAAKAFALYLERLKKEGKQTQNKIPLPDFFIGAHAASERLTLATRDPDRIRTYFPEVKLITP
jgi:predicted nucleic acid-binding protein